MSAYLLNTLFRQQGICSKSRSKGKVYDGVCNVGYKPTFYEKRPDQPAIEVNLLILTKKYMASRLNYNGSSAFAVNENLTESRS